MPSTSSIPKTESGAKVIALVSTAHFFSHFYLLILPPLFPVLREHYGVGYTELGLSITVFSVVSAVAQPLAGFLVDRYGARTLLIAGLVLEAVAFAGVGLIPSYGALLALMVAAGLANAVYHPADYAILNACIDGRRMARAFSFHTFSGYLGGALGPVTIIALAALTGWQTALVVCGAAGLAVAVALTLNGDHLISEDRRAVGGEGGDRASGWGLLFSAPVLLGALFFFGLSMSETGVNRFSVSYFTLVYDTTLAEAGAVLTAFLLASPVGVLAGGVMADRTAHHERVVALCLGVFVLCAASVALWHPPLAVVAALFVVGGFAVGFVAPSRDMLIRSVAPPGQTGKVFGFVSSGFNLAGIFGPVLFGHILDRAPADWVFWTTALLAAATLITVLVRPPKGGEGGVASAAAASSRGG